MIEIRISARNVRTRKPVSFVETNNTEFDDANKQRVNKKAKEMGILRHNSGATVEFFEVEKTKEGIKKYKLIKCGEMVCQNNELTWLNLTGE